MLHQISNHKVQIIYLLSHQQKKIKHFYIILLAFSKVFSCCRYSRDKQIKQEIAQYKDSYPDIDVLRKANKQHTEAYKLINKNFKIQ